MTNPLAYHPVPPWFWSPNGIAQKKQRALTFPQIRAIWAGYRA